MSNDKEKDPAVLFYTADFLVGVQGLTMEERGQYITLLCLQHQQGHLSEKTIFLSVGELSEDVKAKFLVDGNGLYYQYRMDKESAKREAFVSSRQANGQKGGRPPKPKENHMVNLNEIYEKPYGKPNENLRENENINRDIIEYLNNKLGTKYSYTAIYISKHINARLAEGYTLEDFKTVIDKKYREWYGTEFEKFLRPDTLFGTKFTQYLNQIESTSKPPPGVVKHSSFNPNDAMDIALKRAYEDK
jgi:uncharacterized phage protein (TIGR02220 family)